MSDAISNQRRSLPLDQAPQPNAKVEELRRAPMTAREPGEAAAIEMSHADADGRIVIDRVIESLQTVYDPELPVNIFDLGLIYAIGVDEEYNVLVRMTLTAPGCPVAGDIVREVESKVRATPGASAARVELVWSPPWDKSRMSDAALLELGLL